MGNEKSGRRTGFEDNQYRNVSITRSNDLDLDTFEEFPCIHVICSYKEEADREQIPEEYKILDLSQKYSEARKDSEKDSERISTIISDESGCLETLILPNAASAGVSATEYLRLISCKDAPNLKTVILPISYKDVFNTFDEERSQMFTAMRQSFGDEFVNNIGQPNGTTLKFIDSQGRIYGVNRNPENAQTFAKGSLKPKINEDAHQAGTQNASQKGQLSAPWQRSKLQTPTRKIK